MQIKRNFSLILLSWVIDSRREILPGPSSRVNKHNIVIDQFLYYGYSKLIWIFSQLKFLTLKNIKRIILEP